MIEWPDLFAAFFVLFVLVLFFNSIRTMTILSDRSKQLVIEWAKKKGYIIDRIQIPSTSLIHKERRLGLPRSSSQRWYYIEVHDRYGTKKKGFIRSGTFWGKMTQGSIVAQLRDEH